jgi:hypothetical protein
VGNNLPDDLEIKTKTVVHNAVSESRDQLPRNFQMLTHEFFRHLSRRLAKHFQISDNGINGFLVLQNVSRFNPSVDRSTLLIAARMSSTTRSASRLGIDQFRFDSRPK